MSDTEPVRVNKKELRKQKEAKRAEAEAEAKRSEKQKKILYYRTVSFPVYADDWPTGEIRYANHKSIKF